MGFEGNVGQQMSSKCHTCTSGFTLVSQTQDMKQSLLMSIKKTNFYSFYLEKKGGDLFTFSGVVALYRVRESGAGL